MALDGIYLSLLKKELSELIDSRVDRIHQPSKDELIIGMRTRGGLKKILFSANAGSARVHLTTQEIENPRTPPMFCMLLRKHLSSGRLIDIRQDGLERILYFDFEATDEMGDRVTLTLAAEIMGRFSNIILFNADGRIIDSIKRVGQDRSSVRTVLPGMMYEVPPRDDRLNIFECARQEFEQRLKLQNAELSKALLRVFEGVSPIFVRECAFFALRGNEAAVQELSDEAYDRLWFFIERIKEQIMQGKNEYTVVRTKQGSLKDFCFCDVRQYGGLMVTKSF
jgi:predicted ribosome quality control (RQC) complex YloA/Tae2 family protein